MRKWQNPPINSGGLLCALMCPESFWVAQTYSDAPAAFRIAAIGLGFLFGVMAWWSLSKFGLKIKNS